MGCFFAIYPCAGYIYNLCHEWWGNVRERNDSITVVGQAHIYYIADYYWSSFDTHPADDK